VFTNKLAAMNEEEGKNTNSPGYNKNSRRADPSNPNRIMTVGFGYGSEKGTKV